MPITISCNLTKHRHDSTMLPIITTTGVTFVGRLKVADWLYLPVYDEFPLVYPNRTLKECVLSVRHVYHPSADWVASAGIDGENTPNPYRVGVDGDHGAHYPFDLDADECSIEAILCVGGGISLQNNTPAPVNNPLDPATIHGMQFNANGLGQIRELGEVPVVNGLFKYEIGDMARVELLDGIVRYYLVKPDGTQTLIRTTRSKLTTAPWAAYSMYFANSALSDVYIWDNTLNGNEDSVTIETIGVLENFQDWKNEFFISSTADALQMANNESQYTYPNQKKRLRSLSANLAMRTKPDRLAFEDFFNWHGNEKEFIFVDKAKTDVNGETTEWWAKFASPFGDRSGAACLSSHSATILEDYRTDYVPIEPDIIAPTISIGASDAMLFVSIEYVSLSDNIGVHYTQTYVNGDPYGDPFYPTPLDTFAPDIDKSDFAGQGILPIWVIAYDYAGNATTSNTENWDFI